MRIYTSSARGEDGSAWHAHAGLSEQLRGGRMLCVNTEANMGESMSQEGRWGLQGRGERMPLSVCNFAH